MGRGSAGFGFADGGGSGEGEEDDFFAGGGADVVVEGDDGGGGDVVDQGFEKRARGFDELTSDLLEEVAAL